MGMLEQMVAALRKPQLGGMTGAAQQQLSGRAYQQHVQEAQALGQQPLTPEQFAAQGK